MAKIGRNAPCPCGSGKKYKKCCLPLQDQADKERPRLAAGPVVLEEMDDEIDNLDELSNRAVDLIQQGKLDEAEKICHELLGRFPEVHDGLERMAALCEARGQFAEASRYYRQAANFVHGKPGYDPEVEDFFREKIATMEEKVRGSP